MGRATVAQSNGAVLGISPADAAACLTPRRLQLILMPTEACNFRCVYCYESFALKRMKPEVVAGVKALLTRRAPGLRSLVLSWFGGEPTLALDVIDDVMTHAKALERRHPELRVDSDITTNGYLLTESVARRLLDQGVRDYQISLDGPKQHHDRKRVRPGGASTFDRIWGNLVGMKRLSGSFRVTIRLHVDRETADSIPAFLEQIAGEFAGDDRFDLYVRPIARLGGANDETLPVLSKDEASSVVDGLRQSAARLGIRLAGANSGEPICYAAHANSFLVRADGRLNKCTVALDLPTNQVGLIREDGTLELRQSRTLAWMRGLRSGDPGELACPLQGIGAVPGGDRPDQKPFTISLVPAEARVAGGAP